MPQLTRLQVYVFLSTIRVKRPASTTLFSCRNRVAMHTNTKR